MIRVELTRYTKFRIVRISKFCPCMLGVRVEGSSVATKKGLAGSIVTETFETLHTKIEVNRVLLYSFCTVEFDST